MRELSLRAPSLGLLHDTLGGDLRRRVQELVAADPQHVEPRRARVVGEALRLARRERRACARWRCRPPRPPRGSRASARRARTAGPCGSRPRRAGPGSRDRPRRPAPAGPARRSSPRSRSRSAGPCSSARCTASTNRSPRGGSAAPASGARPARKLATAVPAAPGRYGVIRNAGLDRRDRRRGVVVDHERPADQHRAGRADVRDVEAAVGQRPVIARARPAGTGRPRRDRVRADRSRSPTGTTCRRSSRGSRSAPASPGRRSPSGRR